MQEHTCINDESHDVGTEGGELLHTACEGGATAVQGPGTQCVDT